MFIKNKIFIKFIIKYNNLVYKKIMNSVQAEHVATEIMLKADKNHTGKIEYSEFIIATLDRNKLLE